MKRRIRETIVFAIINFIFAFLIIGCQAFLAIAWSISWAIGRLMAQISDNADVRIHAKIIIIIDLVMLILPINVGVKVMIGMSILLPVVFAFIITWLLETRNV